MLGRIISLNGLLFIIYYTFLLICFAFRDKSFDKFLLFLTRENEKTAAWICLIIIGAISFGLVKITGEPIADFIEAVFGFRFRGS